MYCSISGLIVKLQETIKKISHNKTGSVTKSIGNLQIYFCSIVLILMSIVTKDLLLFIAY